MAYVAYPEFAGLAGPAELNLAGETVHGAYRAEVRGSTLPADLLRDLGRSPGELTSHRIV